MEEWTNRLRLNILECNAMTGKGFVEFLQSAVELYSDQSLDEISDFNLGVVVSLTAIPKHIAEKIESVKVYDRPIE